MKTIQVLTAVLSLHAAAGAATLGPFLSRPAVVTATAVDAQDNFYIAGVTHQANLPVTSGAYQTTFPPCSKAARCSHGFIAKFSSTGDLVFATYLGSADHYDVIFAVALGSSGDVYVAGTSEPAEDGAITQPAGFLRHLSSDGSKLLAGKDLPGAIPLAVAMGRSGDVFAAGWTAGPQPFPVTPGAFQTAPQGKTDAFVLRLDGALATTVYATLIGGSADDRAYGLSVDGNDESVYVTGSTGDMRSFPKTPGALLQYSSAEDVFVAKLNASGSALDFSAVFGSNYTSAGLAATADDTGIYIAGITSGPAFPVPPDALLTAGSQFAAKITKDGSSLIWETLLPGLAGSSLPFPFQLAADRGNLRLLSVSYQVVPTTPDSFSPCAARGESSYILEFDPTGRRVYGSYLPGGLAIGENGRVWYADGPSYVLSSYNIHDSLPPGPRCVADALSYRPGLIAPGKIVSLFGPNIGPKDPVSATVDRTGKIGLILGGVSVYFNGLAGPILYAAQNQINVVVPFELADVPESTIVMLKDGARLDGPNVSVAATAPEFVMTAEGCVAAVNADGSINSAEHPAALGSIVSVFGEGPGMMSPAITGGIGDGSAHIVAPVYSDLLQTGTGLPGGGWPVTSEVDVLYAGAAPGFVQGVLQLNLKLPESFATGKQIMHISIGGVGPGGMCLWVGPRR